MGRSKSSTIKGQKKSKKVAKKFNNKNNNNNNTLNVEPELISDDNTELTESQKDVLNALPLEREEHEDSSDVLENNKDQSDEENGRPTITCNNKGCKCIACKCKKNGILCTDACACDKNACQNRNLAEDEFKKWTKDNLSQNITMDECNAEDRLIKSLISRDKWRLVHQCLHFDQVFMETKLNELSRLFYKPLKFIIVDESMAAFRGRVAFLQFLPLKPIKYGLKHFTLADITGYCFSVWLYRGTKSPFKTDTVSIVTDHLKTLPTNKTFFLGTDNYYGSYKLAKSINKDFPNVKYINPNVFCMKSVSTNIT